eukprot:m.1260815 g.1260815  ORF g.1260815 m.1260815 type:complete len:55 (-) comp24729_c0_seq5:344-508(-)
MCCPHICARSPSATPSNHERMQVTTAASTTPYGGTSVPTSDVVSGVGMTADTPG